MDNLRFLLYGSGLLWLSSCANIVAPVGGPRDETPPALIVEESTPNLQTRFEKQTITLSFDEWIVLDDVFNQVLISPPLAKRPEFRIKKKAVIVEFAADEVLLPDATYTINFGDAVRDLTEKNPAENLKFVFSTGDKIDSLFVEGLIREIATREPVEDALFMLYAEQEDSIVYQERPFYFAKSDKEGRFRIDNIREGAFKGFALLDGNLNYLFDNNTEKIAFPDSALLISAGTPGPITLELFENEANLRLLDWNVPRQGLVQLLFNDLPQKALLEYNSSALGPIIEYDKDTLNFWYTLPADTTRYLYFQRDSLNRDTLEIKPIASDEVSGFQLLQPSNKGSEINQNPGAKLSLRFNHPIAAIDTAAWRLFRDTTREEMRFSFELDTAGYRNIVLNFPWQEEMIYELEVMPGGCRDIFGQQSDTIRLNLKTGQFKDYGNIILRFSDMVPDKRYHFELREKSGRLMGAFGASGSDTYEKTLRTLPAGQYNLHIFEDKNGNGRWDTGNYLRFVQPERILIRELEQLRKNWDLEVSIAVEEELNK